MGGKTFFVSYMQTFFLHPAMRANIVIISTFILKIFFITSQLVFRLLFDSHIFIEMVNMQNQTRCKRFYSLSIILTMS
jgi:hypothetical protein